MNVKRATVVIGANYGDEGKGLLTDYHCSRLGFDTVVVRFNGGAQAGHTVMPPGMPDKRTVFHHVGSGFFTGAHTHLSKFFIVNPLLMKDEHERLQIVWKVGVDAGRLTTDLRAPVTTPYDMILNRLLERKRGNARHGSCGLGIFETVHRTQNSKFEFRAAALRDRATVEKLLRRIRNEWFPERCKEEALDLDAIKNEYVFDEVDKQYLEACDEYAQKRSGFAYGHELTNRYRNTVMEGAQGLMLDQDNAADFPFLTPSNTGLKNVIHFCNENQITDLDITYVTRSYLTRHGVGPFAEDLRIKGSVLRNFSDLTNVNNEFQGGLRFGFLDVPALNKRIEDDLKYIGGLNVRGDIEVSLAITCLDQTMGKVPVNLGRAVGYVEPEAVIKGVGAWSGYLAKGPTRDHIRHIDFRTIK